MWKNDFIYNRIIYLIGVKSGITYVISHNFAKTKVDSNDSLPPILHNVIILITSIFNKDKISYYYNIFLERSLYQLPKNKDNK